MKFKALSLSIVTLAASLICGCVFVPKTKIKGSVAGQPFNIVSPKDSDLKGLEITVQTNGTCTIKIDELKARMNPDVVGATADGQAKFAESIMNGSAKISGEVTDKAMKAFAAYLGVPPAPVSSASSNAPAK